MAKNHKKDYLLFFIGVLLMFLAPDIGSLLLIEIPLTFISVSAGAILCMVASKKFEEEKCTKNIFTFSILTIVFSVLDFIFGLLFFYNTELINIEGSIILDILSYIPIALSLLFEALVTANIIKLLSSIAANDSKNMYVDHLNRDRKITIYGVANAIINPFFNYFTIKILGSITRLIEEEIYLGEGEIAPIEQATDLSGIELIIGFVVIITACVASILYLIAMIKSLIYIGKFMKYKPDENEQNYYNVHEQRSFNDEDIIDNKPSDDNWEDDFK